MIFAKQCERLKLGFSFAAISIVTGLAFYVRMSGCVRNMVVQTISALKTVYHSTEWSKFLVITLQQLPE